MFFKNWILTFLFTLSFIVISGVLIHLVWVFCCSSDSTLRTKAAEVVARAVQDKLEGPRLRLTLIKLLPPLLVDAMRDAPQSAVRLFDSTTENPELVWDDSARQRTTNLISQLAKESVNIPGHTYYEMGRFFFHVITVNSKIFLLADFQCVFIEKPE